MRALRDWTSVGAAFNEDDGVALIEDDEIMSDAIELESRDTAVPFFTKSPLFFVQQSLAKMPLPQQ